MENKIKFRKNLIFKRCIFMIILLITFYAIFNFSSQDGEISGSLSRRVTEFIVEIMSKFKIISLNQKLHYIEILHPIIRKLAHFGIYNIVGFSIMGFVCTFNIKDIFKFIISMMTGSIYAITDELHQSFVPGRGPSVSDVCIDSLGVLTGMLILTILILLFETNKKLIKKVEDER